MWRMMPSLSITKVTRLAREVCEIEDAVSFGHLLSGVAQQRKTCAGLLGKLSISVRAVKAYPQHLRARSLELGHITLIRLDLFRSTRCGGANIKRQDHGLLSPKIRELNYLGALVWQREIRGTVADLQACTSREQEHR